MALNPPPSLKKLGQEPQDSNTSAYDGMYTIYSAGQEGFRRTVVNVRPGKTNFVSEITAFALIPGLYAVYLLVSAHLLATDYWDLQFRLLEFDKFRSHLGQYTIGCVMLYASIINVVIVRR